jgi:hypothetical protein
MNQMNGSRDSNVWWLIARRQVSPGSRIVEARQEGTPMAANATEIALRSRFGQILMSDPCQRINFRWGRLHADGSAYSFVALALASRPPKGIGVIVNPRLPANTEASYDSVTNKFTVRSAAYGGTAFHKMSIVHEATHAIADATDRGTVLGQLDETGAYVAGALFNIYSAPSLNGPYPFNPIGQGIFETAHRVAMQIAATPGVALNPQVASPLRQAVLNHPTYAFLRQSPRYTNDGVSL